MAFWNCPGKWNKHHLNQCHLCFTDQKDTYACNRESSDAKVNWVCLKIGRPQKQICLPKSVPSNKIQQMYVACIFQLCRLANHALALRLWHSQSSREDLPPGGRHPLALYSKVCVSGTQVSQEGTQGRLLISPRLILWDVRDTTNPRSTMNTNKITLKTILELPWCILLWSVLIREQQF